MVTRRLHPPFVLLAVFGLVGCGLLACGPPESLSGEVTEQDTPVPRAVAGEGREILRRAAAAARATRDLAYDFEYGHEDDPTGWVSGHTRLHQVTGRHDSWMRVTGTRHPQPRLGGEEVEFDYGLDGESARLVNHTARTYEVAPVDAGSNRLSWLAVYGYLPELIEEEPFWKELGSPARVELLGTETVEGELCDVVRVVFPSEHGEPMDLRWSIARSDRLPRKGVWISDLSGPRGTRFVLTDLETDLSPDPTAFLPEPPEGYERIETPEASSVGDPAPDYALETPAGETVRLADLRGRVVVLDFWNTWCFICRSLAPETRALYEEMKGPKVRFFGVNIFETGDPVAYWREGGFPYPTLLDGEELGRALDLPWQPGIAVLGADGRVLHTQLGGSHDRTERVRRAIQEGLVRLARGRR